MKISIDVHTRTFTGPCPLGLTLRDFLIQTGLEDVPELLSAQNGVVVAPAYSLAILHDGQSFENVELCEPVPALLESDLHCAV